MFIESTKDAAKQIDWVFLALLPNYNMGTGISNLYTNYQAMDLCFTQLPEIVNMPAGKASLQLICYESAVKNMPNPCCKGKRIVHLIAL